MLSMVRVIEADQEDFDTLIEACGNSPYRSIRDAQLPISTRNEIKAMKLLESLCRSYLGKYPTTLEQDVDRLSSGALGPFSNERHAVIQIKGEKEVLHFYLEFARVAQHLLSIRDQAEFDMELEAVRREKHLVIFQHSRNTIARLRQEEQRAAESRSIQEIDLSKPTVV